MPYLSSWRSPSNIALVKYWGKHGIQLPRNPSLSFTLSECHTDMTVTVTRESKEPGVIVLYDGKERSSFVPKIKSYFTRIADQFPWLSNAFIQIDSINTFPHGAGIASSASSMSALALCLTDIDDQIHQRNGRHNHEWLKKVSTLARLGSGSASRSVYPSAALWGKIKTFAESNDEYAIPWAEQISSIYHTYQDCILIVSSSEKSVSSSAGHELMSGLPFAEARYKTANTNIAGLIESMQTENAIDRFISICESEALQLHALMMCAEKPYLLMEPNTIAIIKDVWRFRNETGVPVCFTLDAGPNVHLLYPDSFSEIIHDWIKTTLTPYCAEGKYILDRVGEGPIKL
jgi:diphosphomevalonate decarboxylase